MTTKVIYPGDEQSSSLCHTCYGAHCQICQLAEQLRKKTKILSRIEAECQQHNNPGVNVGAHALAGKVLKILEGEK